MPRSSAAADSVRVLLFERAGAVRISGGEAGSGVDVEPDGEGLRVAGRPAGAVWRVEGRGDLRADGRLVRGDLEVRRLPRGLHVVNRLPLEQYVAATVASEVYPHWPPEMQKAQAVAARTFALYRQRARANEPYDLEAGTRDQVYRGAGVETDRARAAAAATAGQYLVWEGRPILAAFHSASGGRTASAEEVWGREIPYLVSVPVQGEEDSPDTYWRASVSGTTLGRALAPHGYRVGPVREIRVERRSPSGRVRSLRVRGPEGEASLPARFLRGLLGAGVMRSTLFEVRESEDGFVFVGSGHGHGVGMSQWGALAMARAGADYREILAAFYPGTTLAEVELVGADEP